MLVLKKIVKTKRMCLKNKDGLTLAHKKGNVYNERELQTFVALEKQERI